MFIVRVVLPPSMYRHTDGPPPSVESLNDDSEPRFTSQKLKTAGRGRTNNWRKETTEDHKFVQVEKGDLFGTHRKVTLNRNQV